MSLHELPRPQKCIGAAATREARMIRVITGHICSGKSTWVSDHASPADLVIDHDRIAAALSPEGTRHHAYTQAAGDLATAIRWAAIDAAVRIAKVAAVDVWIVHAYPTAADQTMYLRLGATTRNISADAATLTERARVERPERMRRTLADRLAS